MVKQFDGAASVLIGALAPLTRPGWTDAGRQLLAGLELAVRDVNDSGGVAGRQLSLVVRDTAADPAKAVAAVNEFAQRGAAAVVGEYHSVVARAAAARADELEIPFLCSSAVIDALTDHPTDWVARIAPAQSQSWRTYAEFLNAAGHTRIAVAAQSSAYWSAGTRILQDHLSVTGLDLNSLELQAICDQVVASNATAVLILAGIPEPAVSLVKALRHDKRLTDVLIGAPAGQPEFPEWQAALGKDGINIPYLRYLPDTLTPLGARVEAELGGSPSFVAFEGYDTIAALAAAISLNGPSRTAIANSWQHVRVEGTRDTIGFSRVPGINVWQWSWPPIQVHSANK